MSYEVRHYLKKSVKIKKKFEDTIFMKNVHKKSKNYFSFEILF